MPISINAGLSWAKTLKERHKELEGLRNENSKKSTRLFGESKEIVTDPLYNCKALDKLISTLAREIRKLDDAIKDTNAKTDIQGYEKDEAVLGELE